MSTTLTPKELINLLVRLAKTMAQEVELLKEMRVKEIEPLQREKLRLCAAVETFLREVKTNNVRFTEEEREDFQRVREIFTLVTQENQRRLMVATEVHSRVMDAIREAVAELEGTLTYGRGDGHDKHRALSFSLNETI